MELYLVKFSEHSINWLRFSLDCTGDPPVLLCRRKRRPSETSTADEEAVTDADSLTVDAISCGEKIENWIAGLEQELELVSQDKANIIRKEEAIHTNIQVLKGHKAVLVAAVEEHDELLEIIHKLKAEGNKLKKLLSDDESQFRDAKLKTTSSNRQLHELQDSLAEKNTALAQVEQMTNGLLDRAIALQHSLREGLQRKLQHFAASVSRLEAEKLVTL